MRLHEVLQRVACESLGGHQGYKGLLEPPIGLGLVSWVSGQARGQLIVLWRVRVHDCSSGDWCRWPQKFANTEYDSEPGPGFPFVFRDNQRVKMQI